MDLCLVVQAKIWELFLKECARNLWLSYENNMRSCCSCIGNWWAQWTTTMHIIGCILFAIHALYDCFPNLPIFNATKVFSPRNYPRNDSGRITNTELWLERILLKFQYIEEESDMCKGELLEFTGTLQHECENKTIFEAWRICGSNLEWHTNWPKTYATLAKKKLHSFRQV
jgi:hypothetical protein